jgi:hypothetical protein
MISVAALAAAGAAGALAVGSGAVACTSSHQAKVPAKDSFSAHLSAETGQLKGDRGTASIYVATPASRRTVRAITLMVRGSSCGHARHCLRLQGKLHGTLTASPHHGADVGQSFSVSAAGNLRPLGYVTVTGTVHGTGFISRGHETMLLTVSGGGSSIGVDASSVEVPGFTSP